MCWNVDDLIKRISKKFDKDITIIKCDLCRKTKQLELPYSVAYILKKYDNPNVLHNIKYATIVQWQKTGDFLIVIGQNPSQSKTLKAIAHHVDDTNWNIIKILKKNKYAGYIMLNTFPEIDPNGKSFNGARVKPEEQALNIIISEYIIKRSKHLRMVLACTTTNSISKEYYEKVIRPRKVYKISKPPVTHFATQALGKLSSYAEIVITPTTPKINDDKSNGAICTIEF